MSRTIGTTVRGIRAPIVKQGDDLVEIVVDSLKKSWESENYTLRNKDVVGITESLIARAQGNYITIDDIAKDINKKIKGEVGIVFPILSRNRFSMILEGFAKGVDKIHLLLSYPTDEVGNPLMSIEKMDEAKIDPFSDVLSEQDYRRIFGNEVSHPFTHIDYVQMYKDLGVNGNISIHLANDPKEILKFTKQVIVADVHSRERTKRILKDAGAELVLGLDDFCTEPNSRGYNNEYGLYGSNKASETMLKLFPRDGQEYVDAIQKRLYELTGKNIEVMIYGDGAFKDPIGKIWELADPVVSPAYTDGLEGTPNELKLKYLADSNLLDSENQDINEAMKKYIKNKDKNISAEMTTEGTTPRQITDLLGSLCDLTSGSGDKGTPIVLIQGYFDNYADDSY